MREFLEKGLTPACTLATFILAAAAYVAPGARHLLTVLAVVAGGGVVAAYIATRPSRAVFAVAVGIGAAVAAIWLVLVHGDADREAAATPTAAATASIQQAGSPSASPTSLATPVYDVGCPAPGGDQAPHAVLISVIYWCFGNVLADDGSLVPTQRQIKVRLGVKNTCDHTINVSTANPSRIRLLVQGADIDKRWAPTAKTLSAGDRPTQVRVDGQTYWAIPPNVNWAELVTPAGYSGFASKWSQPAAITPGQTLGGSTEIGTEGTTYNGPGAEADLVFQVPADGDTAPIDVVGIAVYEIPDGSTTSAQWDLLGLSTFAEWQHQLEPSLF